MQIFDFLIPVANVSFIIGIVIVAIYVKLH